LNSDAGKDLSRLPMMKTDEEVMDIDEKYCRVDESNNCSGVDRWLAGEVG
jgi:hypothetical protein